MERSAIQGAIEGMTERQSIESETLRAGTMDIPDQGNCHALQCNTRIDTYMTTRHQFILMRYHD